MKIQTLKAIVATTTLAALGLGATAANAATATADARAKILAQLTLNRTSDLQFGTIVTAVSGFIAAGALVGASLLFWSTGDAVMEAFYKVLAVVCGIVAAIALPICIVNMALGPTCHCAVQTAGQSERLRPLRRLRRAKRF